MEAKALVKILGLTPHPEGGYYRRVYESKELCRPSYTDKERPVSTAIYYLLEKEDFSAFHRLKSDEIWHFYEGDALEIYMIDENGQLQTETLGAKIAEGGQPMLIIPAGTWFAAKPLGAYSLVGCAVSPGFDFDDFEMAKRGELIKTYPQHSRLISEMTR